MSRVDATSRATQCYAFGVNLLAVLVALALVIPPPPPGWQWGKQSWEREVRRCYERPTQFERYRCIRDLYGKR